MGNQVNKLKTMFGLVKYMPDDEVVLVFVEKSGSRFIIRNKIDKILLKYLSETDIPLPFPSQIKLHENLIRILGFFLQYIQF
jgi:hypothetical protein